MIFRSYLLLVLCLLLTSATSLRPTSGMQRGLLTSKRIGIAEQNHHQYLQRIMGTVRSYTCLLCSSSFSASPVDKEYLRSSTSTDAAAADDTENDSNTIPSQPRTTTTTTKKQGPKIHPKRQRPRLPILSYRDSWVCINKPTGITVHRSHKQSKFELVVSTTLKRQLRRKVWTVHRLDHRTSGALLFAFDAVTCAKLHDALRHDDAEKIYVALVRGNWMERFGGGAGGASTSADSSSMDDQGNNDPLAVTIDQPIKVDGILKNATTVFRCLATIQNNNNNKNEDDGSIQSSTPKAPCCSLVTADLRTGRRHQIRRHAYYMGMPIIGDSQHGDSKVNRWWRQNMGLNRLALHCLSLDLPFRDNNNNNNNEYCDDRSEDNHNSNSAGNDRIQIVAPLPEDLRSVLERKELADLWQEACQKETRLNTPFIDIRTGTLGVKREWQNTSND